MKWITLFNQIGKQPMKRMGRQDVYAVLRNPKTKEWERVRLLLKFDANGNPYFVQDPKDYIRNK